MKDLVVKSNKLIQALQTLSLSETRLLQLSIVDARETGGGLTTDHPLALTATRYAKAFGVTLDAAYLAMIEAEDTLFKRQFSVLNEDGTWTKSRWIQDANYRKGEGCILITLTRVVIEHVTKLDGFREYFTSYYLNQTANLQSVYAVRLYELIIQWKAVGKTPTILVEKLRDQLGIGRNEYSRMEAFKRRVLDLGIKQINEHTDIVASYEQHKCGRTITGFSFTFKQKNSYAIPSESLKNKNVVDTPINLTEKQIPFFAYKLAHDNIFASKYAEVGEEYSDLEVRLRKKLADQNFVEKISKDLVRLGFK